SNLPVLPFISVSLFWLVCASRTLAIVPGDLSTGARPVQEQEANVRDWRSPGGLPAAYQRQPRPEIPEAPVPPAVERDLQQVFSSILQRGDARPHDSPRDLGRAIHARARQPHVRDFFDSDPVLARLKPF